MLNTYIAKYKEIYEGVQRQVNRLSETIQSYIQVEALPVASINTVESDREFVMKCSSCGSAMFLKKKKNDTKYIGCSNYPQCRRVVWFPSIVKDATITNEICSVVTVLYLIIFKPPFKLKTFALESLEKLTGLN